MKDYTSIRLEVTSRCNLNCDYCHNALYSNGNDDMNIDNIFKLIINLKKKFNINKILITGGEPLVNKDIYNIIKFIKSLDIKVDMVTNGTLLTKDVIRKLEDAGLSRIRISIDELGNTSSYRSNSNPNTLWNTAEEIVKNSNIEVCIHTVCSPSNVIILPLIYKKILEIGAKRWRVFDLGYQGGIEINKNFFNFDLYYDGIINSTREILQHYISNDLKNKLDIEINNIFRTLMLDFSPSSTNITDMLEKKLQTSPCNYVSDHQLTIRSNGKATLCQYFRNTIFDFKKYDYNVELAIKNKNSVCENELLMLEIPSCISCKYCLVCNSGCRSRAKYITGNIKDADPTSCYLTPRICKEIIPLLPKNVQDAYYSFINFNGENPKYKKNDLINMLHSKGF